VTFSVSTPVIGCSLLMSQFHVHKFHELRIKARVDRQLMISMVPTKPD